MASRNLTTVYDDGVRKFIEALGLNPDMTRRIVVDIQHNEPVWIYVEMLADKQAFEIGVDVFAGVDVRLVGTSGKQQTTICECTAPYIGKHVKGCTLYKER